MPPRDRNRLVSWYLLLKDEWLPAQRQRLGEWAQACREEPTLIWQTPQVRWTVIAAVGLTAILVAAWFIEWVAPGAPPSAGPLAKTATFHVVCTNPDCKQHFLIERRFNFDGFPVLCPRCHNKTAQRALRCSSAQCGGRHVAVAERGGRFICTECGADLGPAP